MLVYKVVEFHKMCLVYKQSHAWYCLSANVSEAELNKVMATCSFSSFQCLLLCVSMAFGVLIMASSTAEARAFFVFGDSLVDSGNNNYLATTARADSPPYGIDYPTGQPTGRFSNGLNIPDLIS